MTYPEYILKNFMMTDAEINAHYLADCRRVTVYSTTPLATLFEQTWDFAGYVIGVVLIMDVWRMN